MSLTFRYFILLLYSGNLPLGYTHVGPRTLRPSLSKTSSSFVGGFNGLSWVPPSLMNSTGFNVSCDGTSESHLRKHAWIDPKGFPNFSKFCRLWNGSCVGNKSLAVENMKLDYVSIMESPCFGDPWCQCSVNGKAAPEASSFRNLQCAELSAIPRLRDGTRGRIREFAMLWKMSFPTNIRRNLLLASRGCRHFLPQYHRRKHQSMGFWSYNGNVWLSTEDLLGLCENLRNGIMECNDGNHDEYQRFHLQVIVV